MEEEFTTEGRILCEDDTCIGVVGEDGRCRECGKLQGGTPGASVEPADVPAPQPEAEEKEDATAERAAPDPEERTCCPDDTCIGIIGEDGKCGVCGKGG